ncbi:MAG TPA: CPBP family glutamic-type intramembrane protease [Longimicrobium sp.]|jgi:membrane protease YdiL (CAAX protease family)|nr:CPBP family glutamic-type intramembrane protease [Longimicrobium sp.]
MFAHSSPFRPRAWRSAQNLAVVTRTAAQRIPLGPRARAAALFAWIVAAPLASTLLVVSLVGGGPQHPSAQAQRLVLWMAATLVLVRPALAGPLTLAPVLAGLLRGAVPLCIVLLAFPAPRYGAIAGLAVLTLAAFAEEVVFRWLLPLRCGEALARAFPARRTALLALLAPQVAFALSHAAARAVEAPFAPALSFAQLGQLAVAGVLLQTVRLAYGLGAATGVHVAVNYLVMTGATRFTDPGTLLLLLLSAASLALLEAARRLAAADAPPRTPPTFIPERPYVP